VVEAGAMEEADRVRAAAVLAADADLEAWARGDAPLDGVAREPDGGLRQVVGPDREELGVRGEPCARRCGSPAPGTPRYAA